MVWGRGKDVLRVPDLAHLGAVRVLAHDVLLRRKAADEDGLEIRRAVDGGGGEVEEGGRRGGGEGGSEREARCEG